MSANSGAVQVSVRGRGARARLGTAAVYAGGGVVYAALREGARLDFTASPLLYGLVLLVAAWFRRRLLASAVLMLIWGVAVLLDGKGPFAPDRTAPFFMTAFGLGAAVLVLLRDRIDYQVALESVAAVMVTAGVWFYFVYDFPVLEETWVWTAYFFLYAVGLVAAEWWERRRSVALAP